MCRLRTDLENNDGMVTIDHTERFTNESVLVSFHTEDQTTPVGDVPSQLQQDRMKARRCLTASRIAGNEDVPTQFVLRPFEMSDRQDRFPN